MEIYPHELGEELTVAATAVIKALTARHLESTYTCSARNGFGNDSVTIRLKKKNKGNDVFKGLAAQHWCKLCC